MDAIDTASLVAAYPSQMPRHDQALQATAAGSSPLFKDGELSFKDVLDVINPLQQLPVIGTLYRSLTGDTISTGSQVLGGALFGGPIGMISAAVNAGLKAATGGDVGDHMLAWLQPNTPVTTQMAAAKYNATQNLG